jgi:carbon-monoxide dehydrogenase medium subunit
VNEEQTPPAAPKGSVWTRLMAGKPSGARPPRAEFVFARSVEEIVTALAAGDAAIVAGGMSHAIRRERTGFPQAKRLIAVARVPELKELSLDARGALKANAAVPLQALYDDMRIRNGWQAIDEALEAVGIVRLRRMITVGGSIGPLIGGFDLPVALLALDSRATVAGPNGRRVVALPELFDKRLAKHEMVVGVEVEPLPPRSGSSFFKYMARNVLEIPTVNTAAKVTVDAAGRCTHARVVVGSVSWKPIILEPADLIGQTLDEARVRRSVQNVRALAQPMADVRGSIAYKREMAVEFAARALVSAWQRAARS